MQTRKDVGAGSAPQSSHPISLETARNVFFLALAGCLLIANQAFSQVFVMPAGQASSVASCDGLLLDPGGNGDYAAGQSGNMTIYPDRPDVSVEIELEMLDLHSASTIEVYAGSLPASSAIVTTFGGLLGQGGKIVSSRDDEGALAVVFSAAAGAGPGFQFRIRCERDAPVKVGDDRFRAGTAVFFTDSGGLNEPYGLGEALTTTLRSGRGENDLIIDFDPVDIEVGFDTLSVYDGTSTSGTLLGTLPGGPLVYSATSTVFPALTFDFQSDGSVQGAGWLAYVQGFIRFLQVGGGFYQQIDPATTILDSGGPAGNYGANETTSMTIGGPNDDLDLGLGVWPSLGAGDTLRVYDGLTNAAPLLGTFQAGDSNRELSSAGQGKLTVVFSSDATDHGDFSLRPFANVRMLTARDVTTCVTSITDSGGFTNDYGNNETSTLVLRPWNPAARMRIYLSLIDLEAGFDFLRIYDGTSTSAPLLVSLTGVPVPLPTVTASTVQGGALTLEFSSDTSNVEQGFKAFAVCIIGLFEDGFESGDLGRWSSSSP